MTENNAAVSVIIPTFNRAAYLRASIDGILEQTHAPTQVIVVDDGSTDETAAILEHYGNRITPITKANGGKPSAINSALSRVEGDYLWVFDDDDVACPDALARHVAALDAETRAGFTFSGVYRCSSPADSPYLCIDSVHLARPFPPSEYFLEPLMSYYVASPCAPAFRRPQARTRKILRARGTSIWPCAGVCWRRRFDWPRPDRPISDGHMQVCVDQDTIALTTVKTSGAAASPSG